MNLKVSSLFAKLITRLKRLHLPSVLIISLIVVILTVLLIIFLNAYFFEVVQCGGPEWPKPQSPQEPLKLIDIVKGACEHPCRTNVTVNSGDYFAGRYPSCDFDPDPRHGAVGGPNEKYALCKRCGAVMCKYCNLG